MTGIYLIPVGDEWRSEFERTVKTPIALEEDFEQRELEDFEEIRLWGTTEGSQKRKYFEKMRTGDLLLFSGNSEFFAAGRVGRPFESSAVGEQAWGNSSSRFIFTVTDFEEVSIALSDLWELLGYAEDTYVRGFVRVSDTAISSLLQQYNSVEEAFQNLKSDNRTEERGEADLVSDDVESEEQVREHTEIQWKLIQLGLKHNYDVYVAKNDRNAAYDGHRLGENCIEELALTGFSPAAMSIIEYVDVIWLDGDFIAKMFEVESTTSIFSGILRMTDFVVKVPNLGVEMYVVAPEADEEQVRKQINRPTFEQVLGRAEYCSLRNISFEDVDERYELVERAGPLQNVFN